MEKVTSAKSHVLSCTLIKLTIVYVFAKKYIFYCLIKSGLLIFFDGAISTNRPQIASSHTIVTK